MGQDHPAHDGETILAQEHVLRAAQADALGAELACVGRIVAGVGVGTDGQVALANLVGPGEDRGERGRRRCRRERHLTPDDDPRPAVEGDPIPLVKRHVAHRHLVVAQAQGLGADDGRLAPATRDDRGVADQTATCGEDPLRRQHAVHVLG